MKEDRNDEIICRCEEVTRGEIEEAIREGTITMNELKRHTRCCMGNCQGRTCKRLVEQILAKETGQKPEDILPSTYRQPVRIVSISALKADEEG